MFRMTLTLALVLFTTGIDIGDAHLASPKDLTFSDYSKWMLKDFPSRRIHQREACLWTFEHNSLNRRNLTYASESTIDWLYRYRPAEWLRLRKSDIPRHAAIVIANAFHDLGRRGMGNRRHNGLIGGSTCSCSSTDYRAWFYIPWASKSSSDWCE